MATISLPTHWQTRPMTRVSAAMVGAPVPVGEHDDQRRRRPNPIHAMGRSDGADDRNMGRRDLRARRLTGRDQLFHPDRSADDRHQPRPPMHSGRDRDYPIRAGLVTGGTTPSITVMLLVRRQQPFACKGRQHHGQISRRCRRADTRANRTKALMAAADTLAKSAVLTKPLPGIHCRQHG